MSTPIDTSKLDPATLARHLGNPEGEIGKAVTANLNKINANAYSAALAKLGPNGNERVLEIGFGNGREIPRVLSSSSDLTYLGLDISETMVAEASSFNAATVAEGRVRLVAGSSTAIPVDQAAFDKALAVNTIYFWENPIADLKELRRVLRPGGLLVLGAMAPWSSVGRPVFQHGFQFYEPPEIIKLLAAADFTNVSVDVIHEKIESPISATWDRDFLIVAAE
jgi:SAM-dependent methyltransferase